MTTVEHLEREIQRLTDEKAAALEALSFYADPSDYKAPLTGGMGVLYFDCGKIAREAIKNATENTLKA